MTADHSESDLVVLVADKNMEYALRGLLIRHESLGIRPLVSEVLVHPRRDPGCLKQCHDFLRIYVREFTHALVLLDKEGCGRENRATEDLECSIEKNLKNNGWSGRAKAVVIDPELEIWVWNDSPEVDRILGWSDRTEKLKAWLQGKGFLGNGLAKPKRPKEALEAALRIVRKPRSSAIYKELAETVDLTGCTDRSFLRLKGILQDWFPAV